MELAKGCYAKNEGILRSDVNWYDTLKQKGIKPTGIQQGLCA